MAVLQIGIDRFRKINESFGQIVGNQLLVEVASRLSTVVEEFEAATASSAPALGPAGSAYRAEGADFVVVLEDLPSLRDATRLADRILRAHERPLIVGNQHVLLSLSIGITLGPRGYDDAAEILRDAQTAMTRAKALGRARFEVFDREMLDTSEEELHLETELFRAVETDQLRLWYQPVLALRTRQIVGFE